MDSSRGDNNPYDINGVHFDPQMYLHRLFKDHNLQELIEIERNTIRETQNLQSDMQTLLYENYNRFIAATDTIKKMITDFKEVEKEVELLAGNMECISTFSEQLSSTLQDTRQQLTRLTSTHASLKNLQVLFHLPVTLKQNLQDGNYSEAVYTYTQAQKTLQLYQKSSASSSASFSSIQSDSAAIMDEVKDCLFKQLHKEKASAKELGEAVELLLILDEPASSLCGQFLTHASKCQQQQLDSLEDHLKVQELVEFIDTGASEFLGDLCLLVASYKDMFLNSTAMKDTEKDEALEQLSTFVGATMDKCLSIIQCKVGLDHVETPILVKALDRFYRRLQAASTLLPGRDYAGAGLDMILKSGQRQAEFHLENLKAHFLELLSQARQSLVVPRNTEQDNSASGLAELLTSLVTASVDRVKSSLHDLLQFLHPDLTFNQRPNFKFSFCGRIQEGLVVAFIRFLSSTAVGFCGTPERAPPTLLLLLSKMCLELEASSVHYILSLTDELFQTEDDTKVTTKSELCQELHKTAQKLLDSYVRMQGSSISQMLRKSVDTRDWLSTLEPRTVRAVMKRVVEDIQVIDAQVATLYEDVPQHNRVSAPSKSSFRSNWSSYAPTRLDTSLTTNIQKLFSEPIEIFDSVDFSKGSILTGIVKIGLKTLLECVRLKTFGKFGFQQIQVDVAYLQLHLWQFVADENLLQYFLDEVLRSAIHRCLDPVLMEPGVVDMICERK